MHRRARCFTLPIDPSHAASAAIRIARPYAGEQQPGYGGNGAPSGLKDRMSFKHWYIHCKTCGHRITLEIHNHDHVDLIQCRSAEKLRCPSCFNERTYSGDDFKTAVLTA